MSNEEIIADKIEQILSKNMDYGSGKGGMVSVKQFSNVAKDIITLLNQASAEGYEKGHQEGWDDACCEYDVPEDESENEKFLCCNKIHKDILKKGEEAGRQSAQKEIDDLNREIEKSREYEKALELGHGRLRKELKDFKTEKQEQVRKLKEWIIKYNNPHFNTERLIEVIETEIFPDCAEQPSDNRIL